jgi:peptidoglycan/LPS O-acetylase OafA/YrhL
VIKDKKKYFENLDALRFLAFMFVFFSHLFFSNNMFLANAFAPFRQYLSPYAFIGISFFFTLSGFLITWILLSEIAINTSFSLKNFYIRRSLRIWPLYFLIVAIGYILVPLLSDLFRIPSPHLPNIWWFLTFTSNFYFGSFNSNVLFLLVFLWSIAVEEQFYLAWGALMFFFHKKTVAIVITLLLIYLVLIIFTANNIIHSVYFNTINYFPNFAFGAILAHSCIKKNNVFHLLKNLPEIFWKIFYLVFLSALLFFQEPKATFFIHTIRHLLFTLFFCLLLFDQCFTDRPLFKLGKNKWLNYLGKISYGLYCWHGVVITFVKKAAEIIHYKENYIDVLILFPLLTLFLTVIISIMSYEFFESKFLKLKDYFSAPI